jgi:hypothetical protein
MTRARSTLLFVLANVALWVVMVVILIVVPDALESRTGIELGRVCGWALAGAVWTVAIEAQWRRRTGPVLRFMCQTCLWVSAALVAVWISDRVNMR